MAVMSTRDGPHRLQTSLFDQLFVDTRKADYRRKSVIQTKSHYRLFLCTCLFLLFSSSDKLWDERLTFYAAKSFSFQILAARVNRY